MNPINCQEACVNGCVLGLACPHLPYLAETQKFLQNTSIDRMMQIAADRFAKYAPTPQSTDHSSQENAHDA